MAHTTPLADLASAAFGLADALRNGDDEAVMANSNQLLDASEAPTLPTLPPVVARRLGVLLGAEAEGRRWERLATLADFVGLWADPTLA